MSEGRATKRATMRWQAGKTVVTVVVVGILVAAADRIALGEVPAAGSRLRRLLEAIAPGTSNHGSARQRAYVLLESCGLGRAEAERTFAIATRFQTLSRAARRLPDVPSSANEQENSLVQSALTFLPAWIGGPATSRLLEHCAPPDAPQQNEIPEGLFAPAQGACGGRPTSGSFGPLSGDWCGDGLCNGDEDCGLCPEDCSCGPAEWCGDGACSSGEDCGSCPGDCDPCPPPPDPGPSCGALGGDYCSQSASCPSGYDSLGQT